MTSTAALLLELQTEELPPKALRVLAERFADAIAQGLVKSQLKSADLSGMAVYATPRRIAVVLPAVSAVAPDQPFRQKLMPASVGLDAQGKPTAALSKKLAAMGLDVSTSPLQRESDGKQDVLIVEGVKPGLALMHALQTLLAETIAQLPVPKLMSYQLADGETTVQFARPAHGLIALHGADVVPVHALGLEASRETHGHRFLSSGAIAIASAETYQSQMEREGKVMLSFAARRERIQALIEAAAHRLHAIAIAPDDLLDEVTALVEWPVVYESGFDREFLEVPAECLILTMQQNQKYFALRDASGRLLDRFLLVSNIEATDGGVAIAAGNSRVVRARLADAKFFYDQDRKVSLESRVEGLANVVYHNKLGSQLDRVQRVVNIATALAEKLGVDTKLTARAAELAKADLRSLMVGEFPELQGVMGEYYARHDGEPAAVAVAIREHYLPRHSGDALPVSDIGSTLALADKLETLAGLFAVGQQPTGDKDPFALRRHALGVLRMLMEKKLPLMWSEIDAIAFAPFEALFALEEPRASLRQFMSDRLAGLLRDAGYSAQEIGAVLSLSIEHIDEIEAKLAAVRAFMQLPEAESLAAANKRIGNILKKSEFADAAFNQALLFEPAEKNLAAAYERVLPIARKQQGNGDYAEMLRSLAPLKEPIDRFFDDVMVNVDDAALRSNRLALLAALQRLMNSVADISMLSAG